MKKKPSKKKSVVKHSHMLVVCDSCKIRLVFSSNHVGCKRCDLCGSTLIKLQPWR